MTSPWINCNGTWTNLHYLRFIYPNRVEKDPDAKWIIEAYTDDECMIDLFMDEFNTEKEAQDFINFIMKEVI